MRKKLYLDFFISFFILFILIMLLTGAGRYTVITKEGIMLWASVVLPAVFPYFILTTLLTNLNALTAICKKFTPLSKFLFKTDGITFYPLIISLISGYPIGAKIVADLSEKGIIDKRQSVKASIFSSFASPMFIIGSIGSIMLNNVYSGLIILISHISATLIVGVLFRFYKDKSSLNTTPSSVNKNVDNIIYESVYSGIISLLLIGGIIVLCYILSTLFYDVNLLKPLIFIFEKIFGDSVLAKGFAFSLIEVTGGAKIMASTQSVFLLPLISFSISFGGASIILQSVLFLKKAKIKTAPFVLSKLLSAVLSFFITLMIICF